MITQDDFQVDILVTNHTQNINLPISKKYQPTPVILKKINNTNYVSPIFKVVCIVFLFGAFCYFCFIVINRFI